MIRGLGLNPTDVESASVISDVKGDRTSLEPDVKTDSFGVGVPHRIGDGFLPNPDQRPSEVG